MIEFVYLAVGVVVGVSLSPAMGYAKQLCLAHKPKKEEIVDEISAIKCGACQSYILIPPITTIVTATTAFKVYQCQQCATKVTVPV